MPNCECNKPATGEDCLCEDCRHIRDDDFANIGMYVSDSGEVLDIEPSAEKEDQALEVDGQTITADDIRRIINAFQRTRWALIQSGIELNKRDQTIRRLEAELGDCGYAPTYSVTPYGYDVLRDMGR